MRTETTTTYIANDGTRFACGADCVEHETIIARVDLALDLLGDLPPGGIKDQDWIQRTPEAVLQAGRALMEVIVDYVDHPCPAAQLKVWNNAQHPRDICSLSYLSRVLNDSKYTVLDRAVTRLESINMDTCREYNQPFYAFNPEKADGSEITV